MSLSLCSRQAEFCCHAATQSHSIIVRSIKSCGYPGRCESCLSFRSRCFFFIFLFSSPSSSSHNNSSLWLLFLPRLLLLLTSFLQLPLFTSPLSSLLSSLLQEVPAVMMKVLNIRGNPRRVSLALSHLSFLCHGSGFVEHSTVTNTQWVKYPGFFEKTSWYVLRISFQADLLAVCFSFHSVLFNLLAHGWEHLITHLIDKDEFLHQYFLSLSVKKPTTYGNLTK